jgi:hypothetical protein
MKQNVNFKYQPPAVFVFFVKMVFTKVVHPLKIYQNTKFHGPTLSGASSVLTSEV